MYDNFRFEIDINTANRRVYIYLSLRFFHFQSQTTFSFVPSSNFSSLYNLLRDYSLLLRRTDVKLLSFHASLTHTANVT